MSDETTNKKLSQITWLLAANVLFTAVFAGALVFGVLPKVNKVESRFESFADTIEPVVVKTADKASEFVDGVNTENLGNKAEEAAEDLLDDAVGRILGKD